MIKRILTLFIIVFGTSNAFAERYDDIKIEYTSEYSLSSGLNYLKDIEPINSDGNGKCSCRNTNRDKWEVGSF